MPIIYIASPFGFSEAGRDFMYSKLLPLIQEIGFETLDPWKLTPQKEIEAVTSLPYGEEKKQKWEQLNRVMGKNNLEAIKQADGLFAVLDGVDIDSGTASEIGFAAALGKPVLGYRGDFRLSADNEGSIVNLQVQYFIELNGGKIINTLKDVRKELKVLFK